MDFLCSEWLRKIDDFTENFFHEDVEVGPSRRGSDCEEGGEASCSIEEDGNIMEDGRKVMVKEF